MVNHRVNSPIVLFTFQTVIIIESTQRLPPAPFVLTKQELKLADERAKSIQVPIGYGWKPMPIFTKRSYMKSHDWKQVPYIC